jgi:hypothetical protein
LLLSPARLTTCTLCSSVTDRSVMAYGNRASATMVVNDPSGASISLKVGGYWKNPESLVDTVSWTHRLTRHGVGTRWWLEAK